MMTIPSTVAAEAFKELKAANRELLRAMAREKRYRAGYEAARQRLLLAKRNVKLLLELVQPEFLSGATPDQEQTTIMGEAQATFNDRPDFQL